MTDFDNPSPLIMTHFELISTVAAFAAVFLAMCFDTWKSRMHK